MKNCVRQLRRALELSQEDVATAVGVGRHTIIDIEKGEREPSVSIALRIAKFFNKDPREIFFIDDVNYIQQDDEHALDGFLKSST